MADNMRLTLDPFRRPLISPVGCLNQCEADLIDRLTEENCLLRQKLENQRLHFNGDERRRLPAVEAKKLGWRVLHELTTIVTLETL
jgi:hypothetical protein